MITILIPVYNEAATLLQVLDQVSDLGLDAEILVVNDGSTDASGALLQEEEKRRGPGGRFRVCSLEHNQGKGAAIRTGFAQARGEVVIIQDADLELDPAHLRELAAGFQDREVEVIYGTRFAGGPGACPGHQYLANLILTGVTNLLYGSRITDLMTGFKALRTSLARSLQLTASGFAIEAEITIELLRRRIEIHEIPVGFRPRYYRQGKKIRPLDGPRIIARLLWWRFTRKIDREARL